MGVPLLRELLRRASRMRVLGIAAELAFWLFLALVPLATVAGIAAAKLAVGDLQTADISIVERRLDQNPTSSDRPIDGVRRHVDQK